MQRENVVGNDRDARSGGARDTRLLFVDDELQPPFPLNAPDTLYIRERPRIALTNCRIVTAQHRDQGVNVIRTHDDLDEQRVERIHDNLRNGLLGRPVEKTLRPETARRRTGADRLHENLSGRDRQLRRCGRIHSGHELRQKAAGKRAQAARECTKSEPPSGPESRSDEDGRKARAAGPPSRAEGFLVYRPESAPKSTPGDKHGTAGEAEKSKYDPVRKSTRKSRERKPKRGVRRPEAAMPPQSGESRNQKDRPGARVGERTPGAGGGQEREAQKKTGRPQAAGEGQLER